MYLNIDLIQPSPNPIRKTWDEEKMNELAQSIKEQGLIVPVKVRPLFDVCSRHGVQYFEGDMDTVDRLANCPLCDKMLTEVTNWDTDELEPHYEIVYGHRRVEAARRVPLDEIEVIVEGMDDTNTLIQALIENVVREDMNDADKGSAFVQLKEITGKTWREIGEMFGISEDQVMLIVRFYREGLVSIQATATHYKFARDGAKGNLKIAKTVFEKADKEGLSIRQTKKVAESVANTQDPVMRQKLIDAPYSPYTHDPEYAKERADRYGAHDPMAREKTPAMDEAWRLTVEVSMMLNFIKKSREMYEEAVKMDEIGKFAPEARPFIARKLRQLVNDYEKLIERLEN